MKFFYSTIIKLLPICIGMFLMSPLSSQNYFNSAYSRYGLGLLESPGTFTHFGMGGLNTAVSDPFVINFSNPASYSFLDLTTLQVSGKGGFSKLSTTNESASSSGGQINELGLGFKKPSSKWGIVIGVTPYSKIDYSFSSSSALNDSIKANYNYSGSGGLNRAILGTSRLFRFGYHKSETDTVKNTKVDSAIHVLHQLAFGANLNYVFGNLTRNSTVSFNINPFFATHDDVNVWARGFIFETGFLYKVNVRTRRDEQKRIIGGTVLQLGADYMLNSNLTSNFTNLIISVDTLGTNYAPRDTIEFINNEKGKLKIPQRISLGMAIKMFNKKLGTLTVGFDYRMQDWSKYYLNTASDANLDDGMKSSNSWSLGLEYKPTMDLRTDFFHRLNYRAGIRSTQSSLYINETRVLQQGISAGITIPIIKSASKFHIGAEYGVNGTTENSLVKENYLNIQVGLTLTPSAFDRWFRQVKYD